VVRDISDQSVDGAGSPEILQNYFPSYTYANGALGVCISDRKQIG